MVTRTRARQVIDALGTPGRRIVAHVAVQARRRGVAVPVAGEALARATIPRNIDDAPTQARTLAQRTLAPAHAARASSAGRKRRDTDRARLRSHAGGSRQRPADARAGAAGGGLAGAGDPRVGVAGAACASVGGGEQGQGGVDGAGGRERGRSCRRRSMTRSVPDAVGSPFTLSLPVGKVVLQHTARASTTPPRTRR